MNGVLKVTYIVIIDTDADYHQLIRIRRSSCTTLEKIIFSWTFSFFFYFGSVCLEEFGWFGGMLEEFVREKHCS